MENIIYICYKTSYLIEEVNGTEPSPLVSVPCFKVSNTRVTKPFFSPKFSGDRRKLSAGRQPFA
jgi:hypothetical protein